MKVKINRQQLVKPEMNTLNVMLGTLNLVSLMLIVVTQFPDCVFKYISIYFYFYFFSFFLMLFFLQALVAEQESKDSGGASIAEQVLSIMEIILDEANAEISEDKVAILSTFYLLTQS